MKDQHHDSDIPLYISRIIEPEPITAKAILKKIPYWSLGALITVAVIITLPILIPIAAWQWWSDHKQSRSNSKFIDKPDFL